MSVKNKVIKWIFTRILILGVFLLCFIFWNLRYMSVEDRYGDLQDLYWKSKDGDIAFNKLNSDIAIIETDLYTINVRIGEKLIAIDEWLDPNNQNIYNVAIYRPKEKIENLKLFDKTKSDLVIELKVEY